MTMRIPQTQPELIAAELLANVTTVAECVPILAIAVAKYIAADREAESLRQQYAFMHAYLEGMTSG